MDTAPVASQLVMDTKSGMLLKVPSWISRVLALRVDRSRRSFVAFTLLGTLVLTGLIYVVPIRSDEYLRGWDARTHIFFASGYSANWWDTWDPRWYGGYSRLSYPPLAHQLVAIGELVTGSLTRSYEIVAWVFLAMGPLAAYGFSRNFTDEHGGAVAALLFAFVPSIRSLLFVYGQFAGFVSLVLLLFAMSAMGIFLRGGSKVAALSAVALTACVAASHHGTTIFLLPLVALVTIVANLVQAPNVRQRIARSMIMILLGAVAVLLVVFPFWAWFLTATDIQTPIPHPSRTNILQDPYLARVFFLDLYGPTLIAVPITIVLGLRQRQQVGLALAFALFLLLGLGGTTPLPSWLYGQRWQWLTYERFGVWATMLMVPIIAHLTIRASNRLVSLIAMVSLVLSVVFTLIWLGNPSRQRITSDPLDLQPVLLGFAQYPICKERYLALGFDYQLPDLSTYTGAKTLDGLWHSVRTDALLRSSGIGQLSDALYWPNGAQVLDRFLARSIPLPAYCIFINDASVGAAQYRDLVSSHGWRIETTFADHVSLWMSRSPAPNEDDPPDSRPAPQPLVGAYWGIMPILSLLLGIAAYSYLCFGCRPES